LQASYPFLEQRHARRLIRLYGTDAYCLLGSKRALSDLGRHFGADLYEIEIRYLVEHEWALTAEDVLWRRTKRGLKLTPDQAEAPGEFMRAIKPQTRNAAAE